MQVNEDLKPAPLVYEALSGLELLRIGPALPFLLLEKRGKHQPVFVAPGFGADDPSTAPLRAYLRRMGYDAIGWDLGRNDGQVVRLVEEAEKKIIEHSDRHGGAPVHLIGWSLGGVIVRAIARRIPDRVAQVITMGSPLFGGPKHTAFVDRYRANGADVEAIAAISIKNNNIPIECPVTSIYSKRDGIVAWQASIDHVNPQADNVEVDTTHIGMGLNKSVFKTIIRKLSENA